MKQQLNEVKRMQQLAGINESQLNEAVDTLNIQKGTSEEGNKQITLSVLGGGWEENEITLSVEEAKALVELAKKFSGNRNNTISKGVNTADKNSTQSLISIQPDKLDLIIGRKEGSTYKGYDMPIESLAGYLKAQQSIVYQIVEDLPKQLNESIEEETVNVVDSIPEMQRFLKQLAIDLPTIKGIDVNEVKKLVLLLQAITNKVGKGSISPAIDAATNLVTKRTQGLK